MVVVESDAAIIGDYTGYVDWSPLNSVFPIPLFNCAIKCKLIVSESDLPSKFSDLETIKYGSNCIVSKNLYVSPDGKIYIYSKNDDNLTWRYMQFPVYKKMQKNNARAYLYLPQTTSSEEVVGKYVFENQGWKQINAEQYYHALNGSYQNQSDNYSFNFVSNSPVNLSCADFGNDDFSCNDATRLLRINLEFELIKQLPKISDKKLKLCILPSDSDTTVNLLLEEDEDGNHSLSFIFEKNGVQTPVSFAANYTSDYITKLN